MQAAKLSKRTKNKLLSALNQLEEEVQEQKSKQGMLAQLAAQKRLNDRSKRLTNERNDEVERQFIQTLNYDSAVRSINLSKYMKPTMFEGKNSYTVISMLDET